MGEHADEAWMRQAFGSFSEPRHKARHKKEPPMAKTTPISECHTRRWDAIKRGDQGPKFEKGDWACNLTTGRLFQVIDVELRQYGLPNVWERWIKGGSGEGWRLAIHHRIFEKRRFQEVPTKYNSVDSMKQRITAMHNEKSCCDGHAVSGDSARRMGALPVHTVAIRFKREGQAPSKQYYYLHEGYVVTGDLVVIDSPIGGYQLCKVEEVWYNTKLHNASKYTVNRVDDKRYKEVLSKSARIEALQAKLDSALSSLITHCPAARYRGLGVDWLPDIQELERLLAE